MDYKDSLLAIGEAGWSVCWQSDMTISMRRKAIGSNAIPCSGEHAGEPKALFCFSICDLDGESRAQASESMTLVVSPFCDFLFAILLMSFSLLRIAFTILQSR